MVKATEIKSTKATRAASNKPATKSKGSRAPSAYNNFVKANMAKYREEHPDVAVKDALKAVAALWRDAPENPKRGQEPKAKGGKKTAPKPKKTEEATSEAEPQSD